MESKSLLIRFFQKFQQVYCKSGLGGLVQTKTNDHKMHLFVNSCQFFNNLHLKEHVYDKDKSLPIVGALSSTAAAASANREVGIAHGDVVQTKSGTFGFVESRNCAATNARRS